MRDVFTNIGLAKPSFTDDDKQAVLSVLDSGKLVQGEMVLSLEQSFCKNQNIEYASAVSNGTASLHLALVCLGIGKGDEVIVPAFSYIATANVVELVGAKPVFVDVSLDTFNIDVDQLEAAITHCTKCIIPVHEFGLCANMPEVMCIANRHGLFVIEDSACALGAQIDGKASGSFGHLGSFSLHPRKAITSGEGGVVVTNSADYDFEVKTLRNHGIKPGVPVMDFIRAGFNYRMTDFQAALVNSQFKRLPEYLAHKAILAEKYLSSIEHEAITLPKVPQGFVHAWQTFHVLVDTTALRDALRSYLMSKKIFTNYGAQSIPHMTFYKEKYGYGEADFVNAYRAYSCGLAIPMHEHLLHSEAEYIIESINQFNK